jgi:hypothetical protein
MAFPLLPLLLVAGAGAAVYALTQGSGPSNKTVVKHGVQHGPMCSTIKVVDMAAYSKFLEGRKPQLDALGQTFTPATRARDALVAVMQLILPGPGCNWADPSFDSAITDPTGGDVTHWAQMRGMFGDMTLMAALEAGMFDIAGGLQLSAEPTFVGYLYSSILYRIA